ncbi:MAG: hypothetical protein KatS3mg105_3189 [Gemmatales bacterium]|nr:MAG: hypothetical protein KatS3mg105_3189 [Gemmatales bacterium]
MCVSVDSRRERARRDQIGEMVRKTNCVTGTASGRTSVITASGKKLGDVLWINERLRMNSLKKILAAWDALPEEERKPGLKVDYGPPDPKRSLHRPPKGALILAGQFRRLMRDRDGSLRYTEQSDYNPGEGQRGWARLREPAQDMMWIPQDEWQAMIPSSPQKGQRFSAPPSFIARLARYQLDPERGLGEGCTYVNVRPKVANVDITLEEVTKNEMRLRLDGKFELAVRSPGRNSRVIRYQPALLGFLTYDRRKQQVTGFQMLAFGPAENAPRGVISGQYYLGIAYDLVTNPTEAQLVWPPRRAG